jgi:regulatory protein
MKVEKLKENNKSYSVTFVDVDLNKQEYVVSEDLVVNHRLIKGKVLDETAFRLFKADLQIDASLQKAKKLLSRYPKTIEETKTYLHDKTATTDDIDRIIKSLIALHYLDDFRFVKQYFERYFHADAIGPLKIAFDLKNRGVAEHIITGFINRITEKDIELNIEKLFYKKIAAFRQKPKTKAMLSMKQYLYQKGYSLDIAETYVMKHAHEFANIEQENQLLEKDFDKVSHRYEKINMTDYERKNKIIQSLMNKGYRYEAIKQCWEGRSNHDGQNN